MRLTVDDIPAHFPHRISGGRLLGVFPRLMNLSVEETGRPPAMITIDARDDAPVAPGTARTRRAGKLDFTRAARPGAAISLRAGMLRIADSDLQFDFRRAVRRLEDSELAAASATMISQGWQAAWEVFTTHASPAGFTGTLSDVRLHRFEAALADRVCTHVPGLLQASVHRDRPGAWRHLAALLGTGPGLTPSGDDFATGFFLGLLSSSNDADRLTFADALMAATLAQSDTSTDVSRAYFEHAAAGRFSAPMRQLATGICAAAEDLPACLKAVLSMGHSSGRDAAFGLFCGLAVSDQVLVGLLEDRLATRFTQKAVTQ